MKCRRFVQLLGLPALLWAASSTLIAQTTMAEVTGRITDPSGAASPGATVTLTKMDTGIRRATVTNNQGYYTVPQLPPGSYRVDVELTGFVSQRRTGITLQVNQVARMDFSLYLGEVKESVSVQAEAPILNTAEASLGTVVENTKIANLPLNGRNPFDLVQLTPGTQVYGRPDLPGNNIPLSNFSTNGGPSMTNEVLLDGAPNTAAGRQNEFIVIPSVDAVQEFKVQSGTLKAEFGRSGGGVVNLVLKSGTNQLHGTLFEFLRNDKFDANNWFNNRSGRAKPPFRFNQFGGTVGGPIVRNKTFFFLNYEGLHRRIGSTFLFTVPREDMRVGDFSKVRTATGALAQIFDPLTTRLGEGGSRSRDAFPGNVIPRTRLNAASLGMLEYWGKPNLPGNPNTGASNFISTAPAKYGQDAYNVRIDHNVGTRHFLFGRLSWDNHESTPPNLYGNIANPSSGPQQFLGRNAGLHDTWTISPTTIATFRIGYARLHDHETQLGDNFDIQKLGFSRLYAAQQPAKLFPRITVSGMDVTVTSGNSSVGSIGQLIDNISPNMYTAQTDLTKIRGKHVFKAGADARVYRRDGAQKNNAGGMFTFSPGFTQGPDPTRPAQTSGHAFASYLLGAGSGSLPFTPDVDLQGYYLGFFVQDDVNVTSNLTLNAGVRYEFEACPSERYNKLTFLDFNAISPVQSPSLGRQLTGGLRYTGQGGNPHVACDIPKNNFGPRLGLAYRVGSKSVVRAGYGLMYVPQRTGNAVTIGYSANTPLVSSVDGFTPDTFLNNPFPNGLIEPTGNSLGLLTNVGQALVSVDRDQRLSYMQQWNFGVQRTLPGSTILEVVYSGSKGTHLDGDWEWNQIASSYLDRGNALLARVPNPFLGQIPASTTLGQSTVAAGQLLRPRPQFTSFGTVRSKMGNSNYHSMQLRLERRFSAGWTYLISYTVGKLIDDGAQGILGFVGSVPNYQNYNNRKQERSLSSQETPQRLVFSSVYELPLGPGKRFLNTSGPMGKILGGWQVNGLGTLQRGIPLAVSAVSNPTLGQLGSGTLRPDNNGTSARLDGPTVDRLNRYFDTAVFSQPAPFKFGNVARTLPDVRGPGLVNLDLSLIKNTKLSERVWLEFRAEAFNILNDTNFGLPGTAFGTPDFGVISSAGAARIGQLGLKVRF